MKNLTFAGLGIALAMIGILAAPVGQVAGMDPADLTSLTCFQESTHTLLGVNAKGTQYIAFEDDGISAAGTYLHDIARKNRRLVDTSTLQGWDDARTWSRTVSRAPHPDQYCREGIFSVDREAFICMARLRDPRSEVMEFIHEDRVYRVDDGGKYRVAFRARVCIYRPVPPESWNLAEPQIQANRNQQQQTAPNQSPTGSVIGTASVGPNGNIVTTGVLSGANPSPMTQP